MKQSEAVTIFIPLLDEGTPTVRKTQAIPLGHDLYKVLPASDYDPESETWEFPPDSIVRCDLATDFRNGEKFLRAYEMRLPDGTFLRAEDLRK